MNVTRALTHVALILGTSLAIHHTPEPVPERTDPASQADDDYQEPHEEPTHRCPVCQEVLREVELRRAAYAGIPLPTVTRPSAGIIVVEGALYAGTIPFSDPIRGQPIPMADMAHVHRLEDPIWFAVDPETDYQVWTAYGPPGEPTIPAEYTVAAPSTRLDRIQHYLALAAEAERLKAELAPITFMEIVAALARTPPETAE